jgi:putative redox protein
MEYIFENDLSGTIGTQKYLCQITWRNGVLLMDEPENLEGQDLGPDPYTTLLAALAGCTLSTLRMYIDRKGWDIPQIEVRLNMAIDKSAGFSTDIKRAIIFPDHLPDEQKERLLLIAGKCPVSRILENSVTLHTTAL